LDESSEQVDEFFVVIIVVNYQGFPDYYCETQHTVSIFLDLPASKNEVFRTVSVAEIVVISCQLTIPVHPTIYKPVN